LRFVNTNYTAQSQLNVGILGEGVGVRSVYKAVGVTFTGNQAQLETLSPFAQQPLYWAMDSSVFSNKLIGISGHLLSNTTQFYAMDSGEYVLSMDDYFVAMWYDETTQLFFGAKWFAFDNGTVSGSQIGYFSTKFNPIMGTTRLFDPRYGQCYRQSTNFLYAAMYFGKLGIWNLDTHTYTESNLNLDTPCFYWQYSEKQDKLYCLGSPGADLYYIDISSGIPTKVTSSNLGEAAFVMGAALDDNNEKLYISYEDILKKSTYIAIMEIPSGKIIGTYVLGSRALVFDLVVMAN